MCNNSTYVRSAVRLVPTKNFKKRGKQLAKKMLPKSAVERVSPRRDQRRSACNTYKGSENYTIVCPVYNVEKYLDDFFESIFNQTMNKRNIRVIAVDDGSTDNSAEVIKRWQKKWPRGGITYLRKENGGAASARNLGMKRVKTEWVTFIDPDDFVHPTYFEEVDKAIRSHPSLQLVSCHLIYYFGESGEFSDAHPLNYRFKKGDRFFDANDEKCFPQTNVTSAFMRMSQIREHGLKFSEKVYPIFEDSHFVGRYLLSLERGAIGFLANPKLYYRKREDKSSTTDTSYQGYGPLLVVPRYGHLDLLRYAQEKKGYVSRNTQMTVLYALSWTLKRYLGHPERSEHIEKEGRQNEVLSLFHEIYSYIDVEVLFSAPSRWLSYGLKDAIAHFFKDVKPPYYLMYVRKIDLTKKRILIEAYDYEDISFCLGDKLIKPLEVKRDDRYFFGKVMYSIYECWLSYEDSSQTLSFRSKDGAPVRLSDTKKRFQDSVNLDTLINRYTANWDKYIQEGDTWIIMDRVTQADDNGEHFYRWMMKNHPEQRCLFVLRKKSVDWKRLENEGFQLLDFGSEQHEQELKACSKIISAHADALVHSYFGDNFHKSKDFIVLQHGVIHTDLSNRLNPKPISLFITTTPQEYDSIVSDGSPYKFTKSQVLLSGLPRHDALLEANKEVCNPGKIVVMPSWRNYLLGARIKNSNERPLNPEFVNSDYKKAWESFLVSPRLKKIADDSGKTIAFFPHANILPYAEAGLFSIPDYVELGKLDGTNSIQDYFCDAAVLITDYSSVAFEVAYLDKPCLYYQFDFDDFFGGGHTSSKGYFDYVRDGFGPVVTAEDELLDALECIVQQGFRPTEEYKHRMDKTFIFRDGKCCERVYEAIKALD